MSAEFTPIADIQHPRIRTEINLPYDMEERIGLNTRYLQTLIQIGGMRHVRISTKNDKMSKTEISIIGINNDGSAVAGKAKTETVPTHSQNLTPDEAPKITSSKNYFWPTLNILLNPDEMRERENTKSI